MRKKVKEKNEILIWLKLRAVKISSKIHELRKREMSELKEAL